MSYNSRVWLNPPSSHFTGSVVCHDGVVTNQDRPAARYTFVEVSSCHGKVRLHTDKNFGMSEFITKLETLRDEIDAFVDYLKEEN
jgi:hypothetical protein